MNIASGSKANLLAALFATAGAVSGNAHALGDCALVDTATFHKSGVLFTNQGYGIDVTYSDSKGVSALGLRSNVTRFDTQLSISVDNGGVVHPVFRAEVEYVDSNGQPICNRVAILFDGTTNQLMGIKRDGVQQDGSKRYGPEVPAYVGAMGDSGSVGAIPHLTATVNTHNSQRDGGMSAEIVLQDGARVGGNVDLSALSCPENTGKYYATEQALIIDAFKGRITQDSGLRVIAPPAAPFPVLCCN